MSNEHTHPEFVPGCFRCELSSEEALAVAEDQRVSRLRKSSTSI